MSHLKTCLKVQDTFPSWDGMKYDTELFAIWKNITIPDSKIHVHQQLLHDPLTQLPAPPESKGPKSFESSVSR